MKKITSIILTVALCFSMFIFNTNAVSLASDNSKIIKALNAVEAVKEQFGLSSVDFDALTYSDSIYAYDYTENGLIYNSEFIPILYDSSLIGWVMKKSVETDVIYQFSTAFASQVNFIVDNNTDFAFIYDSNTAYLYADNQLYKLNDIPLLTEKSVVINDITVLSNSKITLNNFSNNYNLHYTSQPSNTRAPIYYKCNVSYVTQDPAENLCWAASVACIANYLNGTNLTAFSVAQSWFNSTTYSEYNKMISSGTEDNVLRTYGISYTYKRQVPSDSIIYKNIYNGYPILATFQYSSGYHAVVIYGINITGSYLYVMDPLYGFCSTTYSISTGHTYINPRYNVTLTLNRATCKYWTA